MSLWRRHTTGLLAIGIAAILIAVAVAFMVTNFQPTTAIRLGTGVFQAQVVSTPEDLYKGLSGVDELKPNEAMLFDFGRSERWGIVMRDMKIPLDIVWLDESKKVIYIVTNANPELGESKEFRPQSNALYVIEMSAGAVSANNIKIGDEARFDIVEEQS